jgi:hypothetical protein
MAFWNNFKNVFGGQSPQILPLEEMQPLPLPSAPAVPQIPEPAANTESQVRPNIGQRFQNAMLGTPVQMPEIPTSIDSDGNITGGVQTAPRQGGFLRDLAAGFNDNYNNGFALDNWGNGAGGSASGTGRAFRGGEAMGTLARQFSKLKNPNVLNGLSLALATGSDLVGNYHGSAQSPSLTNLNNMNYRNRQLDYLNDYRKEQLSIRRESNQLKAAIANESNLNRKAQMIFSGVNNGVLSPEQGTFMLNQYGIDAGSLQKSNQSKVADVMPGIAAEQLGLTGLRTGAYVENTNAKTDNQNMKNDILKAVLEEIKKSNSGTGTNQGQYQEGQHGTHNGKPVIYRGGKWQYI